MNKNFRRANDNDKQWPSNDSEYNDDIDSGLNHQSKRYRNLHNNAARKKIEAKKRRDLFEDDYDEYN